jgi:hypothetical protein
MGHPYDSADRGVKPLGTVLAHVGEGDLLRAAGDGHAQ